MPEARPEEPLPSNAECIDERHSVQRYYACPERAPCKLPPKYKNHLRHQAVSLRARARESFKVKRLCQPAFA